MPSNVRFVFDPEFEDNLIHWRGTLNPIGDVFRATADKKRNAVQALAKKEAANAFSERSSLYSTRFRTSSKQRYKEASALYYSLSKYAELTFAAEVHDPGGNYAVVGTGHAAGPQIEFGGTDAVIMAGNVPLQYKPMFILRRAI